MLSRSSLPYEFRRGQLDMAQAVERAWRSKHLIVEAGTGTGKTLAYLLPALRTGQRVIISTGTKNLQEQLFFRDVPFLESLLGPLRVCYMKGRANYLCRNKLYALRDQPILNGLEEIDQFQQIAAWEKTTQTGDRVEIDALPEASQVWHKLDARSELAWARAVPIMSAASSPRCGGRRSKAMSSSSTTTCFLRTWPSSSRRRRRPMQACCRKRRR